MKEDFTDLMDWGLPVCEVVEQFLVRSIVVPGQKEMLIENKYCKILVIYWCERSACAARCKCEGGRSGH